jgi:hypothetical protein
VNSSQKKTVLIFLIIANTIVGYSQDAHIWFSDRAFYEKLQDDSVKKFALCMKFGKASDCEKMYPALKDLHLSDYLIATDGDSVKMTAMTESMISFYQRSINDFLALTIYLKQKHYASKKLFDEMLEICLQGDSSKVIAQYELAKLRFNEGYVGLSAFLIDKINDETHNEETIRLSKAIQKKYGDQVYDKKISYKEYLSFNPPYIED